MTTSATFTKRRAHALLTTMGGASGVVFGSLFLAGGKTMHGAEFFGSHELSHLLSQSLKDVMSRGGAKPGDKTMIDALHPAAEAAKGKHRQTSELNQSKLPQQLQRRAKRHPKQ